MLPQQYCLRWKYHHSNLQTMFSQLLDRGCFCDVTLACEGQTIKAHRVVLCACSTYFDAILTNCCSEKDPIIIMKDAKFSDMKCLIEFMYKGEINVEHSSLASLLKTAEELKIKGLAEVSWRDDDNHSNSDVLDDKLAFTHQNTISNTNSNLSSLIDSANTISSGIIKSNNDCDETLNTDNTGNNGDRKNIPLLAPLTSSTPNNKLLQYPMLPLKKKRGRPPLDTSEIESLVHKHKIANLAKSAFADSAHLVSVLMDEVAKENHHALTKTECENNVSWAEQNLDTQMEYDDDEPTPNIIPKLERSDTPMDGIPHPDDLSGPNSPSDPGASSSQPLILTQQELEEWKDVVKMNDYLVKGRRPQFWEEPFCKRVMDAIKNKDLEMKKAAQILGVSYGTLYGRYRETYGCLKHPYRGPFMVSRFRDMWTDQTPNEILQLLQKGVITLPRAAELMNTSPSTVSGLLDQNQEWISMSENVGDKDVVSVDDNHSDSDNQHNDPHLNFNSIKTDKLIKDKIKIEKNSDKSNQEQQCNEKENKISLPNHPEINIINVKTKTTTNSKNNNNDHKNNNENTTT